MSLQLPASRRLLRPIAAVALGATLLTTADVPAFLPPANSQLLAARMPNARLVVLPGARHDFTTDRPAEAGRAIVQFLSL